jgi:hypothetical protein
VLAGAKSPAAVQRISRPLDGAGAAAYKRFYLVEDDMRDRTLRDRRRKITDSHNCQHYGDNGQHNLGIAVGHFALPSGQNLTLGTLGSNAAYGHTTPSRRISPPFLKEETA